VQKTRVFGQSGRAKKKKPELPRMEEECLVGGKGRKIEWASKRGSQALLSCGGGVSNGALLPRKERSLQVRCRTSFSTRGE